MHFPEAQERNPNYYHYFLWKNHVRLTRFLLTRRLQERNPRVNRELTVYLMIIIKIFKSDFPLQS